jgi:periplasmic copper chaperone A
MTVHRSMTVTGGVAALAGLLLASAMPAAAAPEFAEGVVVAGQGRQVVTIRNRFGCDGQPTERFEVQIPEGVVDVTPRASVGWTIEKEIVPSDPYELFGATQTERVGTVRWIGSVQDDEFAEFAFMALFGPDPARYAFPVIQVCADGDEVAWTEVAGDGQDASELSRPAPVVQVVEPPPQIDVLALSDSVARLEEQVAAVEESLGEVTTGSGAVRVPALRNQVTELQDAVANLRERIAELEAEQGS